MLGGKANILGTLMERTDWRSRDFCLEILRAETGQKSCFKNDWGKPCVISKGRLRTRKWEDDDVPTIVHQRDIC